MKYKKRIGTIVNLHCDLNFNLGQPIRCKNVFNQKWIYLFSNVHWWVILFEFTFAHVDKYLFSLSFSLIFPLYLLMFPLFISFPILHLTLSHSFFPFPFSLFPLLSRPLSFLSVYFSPFLCLSHSSHSLIFNAQLILICSPFVIYKIKNSLIEYVAHTSN